MKKYVVCIYYSKIKNYSNLFNYLKSEVLEL